MDKYTIRFFTDFCIPILPAFFSGIKSVFEVLFQRKEDGKRIWTNEEYDSITAMKRGCMSRNIGVGLFLCAFICLAIGCIFTAIWYSVENVAWTMLIWIIILCIHSFALPYFCHRQLLINMWDSVWWFVLSCGISLGGSFAFFFGKQFKILPNFFDNIFYIVLYYGFNLCVCFAIVFSEVTQRHLRQKNLLTGLKLVVEKEDGLLERFQCGSDGDASESNDNDFIDLQITSEQIAVTIRGRGGLNQFETLFFPKARIKEYKKCYQAWYLREDRKREPLVPLAKSFIKLKCFKWISTEDRAKKKLYLGIAKTLEEFQCDIGEVCIASVILRNVLVDGWTYASAVYELFGGKVLRYVHEADKRLGLTDRYMLYDGSAEIEDKLLMERLLIEYSYLYGLYRNRKKLMKIQNGNDILLNQVRVIEEIEREYCGHVDPLNGNRLYERVKESWLEIKENL